MATLDWHLRRTGEVTLVELSVQSDREQQVRLESRLRPVWPPRRQGVPVRGWQDHAFEGRVEAGQPLVVGYASPAPPEEPPAEITETGSPVEDSTVTPHSLVRTLGDSRPPRDVLREPDQSTDEATDATGVSDSTIDDGTAQGHASDTFKPDTSAVETDGSIGWRRETANDQDPGTANDSHPKVAQSQHPGQTDGQQPGSTISQNLETDNSHHPGTVHSQQPEMVYSQSADQPVEPSAWFEAVESRLATTETLAEMTDADEIRAAVDAAGGIEDVRSLQAQLDADRRQLREIRHRSERLAEQLSAVELPLATIERVV